MNAKKNSLRLFLLAFGAVGLFSLSSCNKETTCDCEGDGVTTQVTVEGDCESFEINEPGSPNLNCTEI